ncbi:MULTISPECIES: helix-turn-helix domain-containing protein [Roseateles]|uniref:Transcriptional regulator n=1 Tax=Roseateles puraquae TaxID=431059 RepID=A0A254MXD2_9BURK|nr:helix-turn-helix transcriptional regulator [Roseateles puraquae]MDG0853861.1 XRE family transcriptional regulator [Roseateles puraquae]OWQ96471.1 transcriptional regulator [Roseateles puraquae]RTL22485.1 MAG: XRE family transcriptional regulator [Burkholderiales bacterium]
MSSAPVSEPKKKLSARGLLAANLLVLRRRRELSQEALAFEAGLHRTFVAHVERQARNISLDNIERLASALGVEPFELLKP